jgi:ABC-type cobalamin/Fe3+-siderophores transport system ATPase subunit
VNRDTGEVEEVTVADKKVMHVKDEETGETVERAVYLPVPRIFFAVTVTAPVLAGWYSYSRLWTGSSEEPDEDVQNAVSDGGTDQ